MSHLENLNRRGNQINGDENGMGNRNENEELLQIIDTLLENNEYIEAEVLLNKKEFRRRYVAALFEYPSYLQRLFDFVDGNDFTHRILVENVIAPVIWNMLQREHGLRFINHYIDYANPITRNTIEHFIDYDFLTAFSDVHLSTIDKRFKIQPKTVATFLSLYEQLSEQDWERLDAHFENMCRKEACGDDEYKCGEEKYARNEFIISPLLTFANSRDIEDYCGQSLHTIVDDLYLQFTPSYENMPELLRERLRSVLFILEHDKGLPRDIAHIVLEDVYGIRDNEERRNFRKAIHE